MGIIILGLLVLGLLVYAYAKKTPIAGRPSLSGGASSGSMHRGSFRRAARGAGLSDQEIRFLEGYAGRLGLANPEFVFRNKSHLDSFFKDVYQLIERDDNNEGEGEARKAQLFAIREGIAQRSASRTTITSTRQLGRNLPISFITKEEESYPSIILAVEAGGVAVEPARDAYNEPIRMHRGTRLTCCFYGPAREGYRFDTRVLGWERIGSGEVMVLAHSDSVHSLPARQHARKEIEAPCTYYHITVTPERVGGKVKSHAKVDDFAMPGTVIDISAGGAAVLSSNPLNEGDYIKIVFDPGSGSLSAYGKIVRLAKNRNVGGVMHIKFVKVSQRSLNGILSHVYGYET